MRLIKYLCVLFAGLAYVHASSVEFRLEKDKPLEVKLNGVFRGKIDQEISWTARPATDVDEDFLKNQIFRSAEVMRFFGNREIRDEGHAKVRIGHAHARFGAGAPHGSMIVCDGVGTPIGWLIAGGGDEKGASEVALALIPQVWKQGYGTSLMKFVVETWAPAVRRIGLGLRCDALKLVGKENELAALKEKASASFQCFIGNALERFDATTSPDNIAMQRVLNASGFKAARSRVTNIQNPIQLSTVESLEAQLLKLFEGENALQKEGIRYRAILNNQLVTFSWSKAYNCLKLHYEYDVELSEEVGSNTH